MIVDKDIQFRGRGYLPSQWKSCPEYDWDGVYYQDEVGDHVTYTCGGLRVSLSGAIVAGWGSGNHQRQRFARVRSCIQL